MMTFDEVTKEDEIFFNGMMHMLDKAVNWLTNVKQYINPNDEGAADAFIEAFKNEMRKTI